MISNYLKKTIRNTILLSMLLINAYADSNNTYLQAYSNFSGLSIKELEKFSNEENFKIASAFIFDSSKQENKTINKGDVHDTSGKVEFEEVKVPNYKDALVYFKKSAELTNNPISAYAGSYILQNFTNIQEDANLRGLKLFSDVLYNQEVKICQAYLLQGDIFENGYFVKKDLKRAIEIYKEGLNNKNCKSSWMQAVLNSKLIKLEQNNAK